MELLFQDAAQALADVDRGLAKTLVYGVLRQKEYLDAIIRRFSRHPLRTMRPRTLMTLRIGAYQLLFLSRIPESAAVNATVNTLKMASQPPWLIGFVNGLLRTIARERGLLPSSEEMMRADPPVLNHPAWLLERWQQRFGQGKTLAICRVNATEPPLTLRINSRSSSTSLLLALMEKSGIPACRGEYSPLGLQIRDFPGGIPSLPGYEPGYFQVQDEAGQLASLLVGPLPLRARVLDACAGLGGKASHLAEMLPPGGILTAVEPDRRRFRLLRENLRRLGHTESVRLFCRTLQGYAASSPPPFDTVFVDAPCSGTGVIRRQPDIRWNRRVEDLPGYQRTQLELLDAAAALVKPEGGVLVYATCSLEPEENEEVIRHFLRTHPGFAVERAKDFLPEAAWPLEDAAGFFHPTPEQGLDGFFAARLRARRGL